MRSDHESNGRPEDDEEGDLRLLFRLDSPVFARVNVDAVLRDAAKEARELVSEACSEGSHVYTEVGDVVSAGDSLSLSQRRAIMFQRIGVIGVCAASLCLALLLGVWESNSVLAQVQDAIRKVQTASYTVTHSTGDKQEIRWEVKVLGDELCRVQQPNGIYLVFDVKGRRIMEVNLNESKVRITENLPVTKSFNVIALLTNVEASAVNNQSKLSNRKIGDKEATGFVIEENGVQFNVWIDPTTKLPLEVERRGTPTPENSSPTSERWSDFRFDELMDKSQFSFDVPKGFAVDTRQSPAAKQGASRSYGFGPKGK